MNVNISESMFIESELVVDEPAVTVWNRCIFQPEAGIEGTVAVVQRNGKKIKVWKLADAERLGLPPDFEFELEVKAEVSLVRKVTRVPFKSFHNLFHYEKLAYNTGIKTGFINCIMDGKSYKDIYYDAVGLWLTRTPIIGPADTIKLTLKKV